MTRVSAGGRLHFGLTRVPGPAGQGESRAFGGLGLMVDAPGVVVSAHPADLWQFAGPLASRAQVFGCGCGKRCPKTPAGRCGC